MMMIGKTLKIRVKDVLAVMVGAGGVAIAASILSGYTNKKIGETKNEWM